MKLKLVTIGKIKSNHFLTAAADYAERLAHYLPFEIVAAHDERQALTRISSDAHLVLCDKDGVEFSSEDLAAFVDRHRNRGTKHLTFFIGGPAGIGEPLRRRANESVSLSRMTFPHELAQVIVLEQLYRACTILKGEPYHK